MNSTDSKEEKPPAMDQQLEEVMANILSQSGVVGAIASDKHGLCLCSKGKAPSEASGFLSSIANKARGLSKKGEEPTVCIETESNNIFIQTQDEMTIGIYKIP